MRPESEIDDLHPVTKHLEVQTPLEEAEVRAESLGPDPSPQEVDAYLRAQEEAGD